MQNDISRSPTSSQFSNALPGSANSLQALENLLKIPGAKLHALTLTAGQLEREMTVDLIRHLQAVDRRKLYCDYKCGSLFEYAVKYVGLSEGAAGRRIQTMRAMRASPEIEAKVESGALSLSNVCRVETFFRDVKRAEPERVISPAEKVAVLAKLENKSAREGEKILLALAPPEMLPREKIRQVTPEHVEIRFVADASFDEELKKVRALLGSRGANMNLAELMKEALKLSVEKLSEKKFGKRRVQAQANAGAENDLDTKPTNIVLNSTTSSASVTHSFSGAGGDEATSEQPKPACNDSDVGVAKHGSRYISQATKHAVWQNAGGKCTRCGSQRYLQYDHIHPHALGGNSHTDNLQLLCAPCNQRRSFNTFGASDRERHFLHSQTTDL